jgi:glycosyltransferase involved in cell wall biosynthesis
MIIVCNACTDNSVQICNKLKQKFPLKVIEISQRGKGYALAKGFNEASFDYIGFLDVDNPFNLDKILNMLRYLEDFDMVIVTKYKNLLKYQTSFTRRVLSIAGAVMSRFLFGLRFQDTQAGAKFMKKELWKKLKRPFICTGFEFDMELLYKASMAHAKIKEYYIRSNELDFSTVKARILLGLIYRLFKLRLLK